ncbi:MAG: tetratricopeptide repeat protein [Planctomycetota bacterium]|nr:MAG: tetratricopeptide repeat protein [Planctomycetota bacterium]
MSQDAAAPPPGGDPAPTPSAAAEAADSPGPLGRWVRRQPVFALLLLGLAVGSPFGVNALRRHALRARLASGLARWHAALSRAGLPLPWGERRRVLPPQELAGVPRGDYARAGFEEEAVTLQAWSALLDGVDPEELPRGDGWGATVRACALYRSAASAPSQATLVAAQRAASRGVGDARATLALVPALLDGEHERVLREVRRLQRNAPAYCAVPLEALRREATRRFLREALSERPPSTQRLQELLDLEADTALLAEALAAEGARLGELLSAGAADLARAEALLTLFVRAYPEGLPADGAAAQGWRALRPGVVRLLHERFAAWGGDLATAARVLGLAARLDPETDFVPASAFADWRARLNEVVDQPAELLSYAEHVLEAGWAPSGLDQILRSHFVAAGASPGPPPPGGRRLGELLADAWVRRLAAEADGEEARATALDAFGEHRTRLEALLSGRRDPLARRARALFAFQEALLLHGAGRSPEALAALARAEAAGFRPAFRLLDLRSRIRAAEGATDDALRTARASLAALEDFQARCREAASDPGRLLRFELSGHPVQAVLLDALRCEARLRLAALLADAGKTDEAASACREALRLDPRNARGYLVLAQALERAGRRDEARRAAFEGLRGLGASGRQGSVRDALRALLKRLGPN